MTRYFPIILAVLFFAGCATTAPSPVIPVNKGSVNAGSSITRSGTSAQLIGTPLRVGDPLPDLILLDSSLKQVSLSDLHGSILVLNFVPSLDTGVCERQTKILTELLPALPKGVRVVVVSRDLPFAQARVRSQLRAEKILFLSDYADARFGRSTGLLIEELMLLGRGVMVVDQSGIVRYMQVVPEIAHLPDLDRAFSVASGLATQ